MSHQRVALVTGAATRIGAATAKALHQEGYSVAIHYRSSHEGARALARELNAEREGSAAIFGADLGLWRREANTNEGLPCNLPTICDALIAEVTSTFGDLHVLVNNASAFAKTPLLLSENELEKEINDVNTCTNNRTLDEEMDAEEALFVSNALAPFYLTRSFARYVQRRMAVENTNKNKLSRIPTECAESQIAESEAVGGEGAEGSCPSATGPTTMAENKRAPLPSADRCIILFGDSLVARCPHKTYGVYSLAKIGAENLTQTASTELAPIGIRVNCVRPGFNVFPATMPETECEKLRSFVPFNKKEGEPKDVANAICFLVDPIRAGYLSGVMLDVDGALRHVAMS